MKIWWLSSAGSGLVPWKSIQRSCRTSSKSSHNSVQYTLAQYFFQTILFSVTKSLWCLFYAAVFFLWCGVCSMLWCLFYAVVLVLCCGVCSMLWCLFYAVVFVLWCGVCSMLWCLFYAVVFVLCCGVWSMLWYLFYAVVFVLCCGVCSIPMLIVKCFRTFLKLIFVH